MSKLILAGTQTALNLVKAFAGESQARNRYTFFAETALEAGYPTLRDVFLATAHEERGHAEMFYEYLAEGIGDSSLEPAILVPFFLGNTAGNLDHAHRTENHEWTSLYPSFGKTAQNEGFSEIATSFFKIASVEKRHDERFSNLLFRLNTGTLFTSCRPEMWQCSNCGYRHCDTCAPMSCPACHHEQAFFTIVDPCIL